MARKKAEDFESRLERLGKIVEELETGDLSLERSVALYKEGRALAKACREQLDQAKNVVQVVRGDALVDFEPDEDEGAGDGGD